MNILLLSHEYPPETAMGGVGTYMHSIAHAYAGMGHVVHVLSSAAPGEPTYSFMQDSVHVHRIRRWKFEVPILRRAWHSWFPWTKHQIEYAVGARGELKRLVRENKIEIIESTELWADGFFYSFTRRAPILLRLHTPLFVLRALNHMQATWDWRIVDTIDKWWTRRADHLIAGSRSLAEIVANAYHLDVNAIPVVPVPVNTERFPPLPPAENTAPVIMYLGQLEPRKGVFTVADAIPEILAEIPNARFLFVGNDRRFDGRSCEEMIRERLAARGVARHAEFLGRVPNAELSQTLRRASVCLFPSQWEAVGIACLEAMASARPVIASNTGGLGEMIEDGESGLLVPPGNASALAAAVRHVLQNPELARRMALNAHERVRDRYSTELVARRNLEEYAETIARWQQKHANSFAA